MSWNDDVLRFDGEALQGGFVELLELGGHQFHTAHGKGGLGSSAVLTGFRNDGEAEIHALGLDGHVDAFLAGSHGEGHLVAHLIFGNAAVAELTADGVRDFLAVLGRGR